MLVYRKSNQCLTIGLVYSAIIGSAAIGLGVYIFYNVLANWSGTMDPITTLLASLAQLYGLIFGLFLVLLGDVSFLSFAFAICAMKAHKKRYYKLCQIFSAISVNPFSLVGANMGLKICHDLKEAEKFLNED